MIHRFAVERTGNGGKIESDVAIERLEGGRVRLTHAGRTRVYEVQKLADSTRASTWSLVPEGGGAATLVDVDGTAPELTVTLRNVSVPLKLIDPRRKQPAGLAARPEHAGPVTVRSPMPGKVVKLLAQPGDEVKAGHGVVVVEAMKMENELKAPRDGKVKSVAAKEGQAVEAGAALVVIE